MNLAAISSSMVLKDSEKKECDNKGIIFYCWAIFLVESTAIGSLSKCTAKRIKVEKIFFPIKIWL